MKIIQRLALGLAVICLIASLTACAKPCPPARPMLPPVVYLQDEPEPKLTGKSNADLANWAIELREAVRQSNSDKAALREWADRR